MRSASARQPRQLFIFEFHFQRRMKPRGELPHVILPVRFRGKISALAPTRTEIVQEWLAGLRRRDDQRQRGRRRESPDRRTPRSWSPAGDRFRKEDGTKWSSRREWIRKAKQAYIEYAAAFPYATFLVRQEADKNMLFRSFLDESRSNIKTRTEDHRREDHAARVHGVVPMSLHEDVTGRSPDVMRGDPDPVRIGSRPKTGAPGIVFVPPHPMSGNPDVIRIRGNADGALLERVRRLLRQVSDLRDLAFAPESGDPLRAAVGLRPIAGHPLDAGVRLGQDEPPGPAGRPPPGHGADGRRDGATRNRLI